jgi:hypothetical protein
MQISMLFYAACVIIMSAVHVITPVYCLDSTIPRCARLETMLPEDARNYCAWKLKEMHFVGSNVDAMMRDLSSVLERGAAARVSTACADAVETFMCNYYFPACMQDICESCRPYSVRPCKSVCEDAITQCSSQERSAYGGFISSQTANIDLCAEMYGVCNCMHRDRYVARC